MVIEKLIEIDVKQKYHMSLDVFDVFCSYVH